MYKRQLQGGLLPRELSRGWLAENASDEQRAFLAPESTQWDAPLDADKVPAVPGLPHHAGAVVENGVRAFARRDA